MPWTETCAVELRESLVLAMLADGASVAELCRRAGVARKTAYKWLARYRGGGRGALADRSRARRTQAHAVSDEILDLILTARHEHPTWGARKLLPYLARRHAGLRWPCPSTVGTILRDAGTTRPPGRPRPARGAPADRVIPTGPNHTWTVDFKGQFRLGDGLLCYPLTVADAFSRYLLRVDAKPGTHLDGAWRSFRALFRVCGLPERIRSDNGTPFAGTGLARLSRLSVRFLHLGIAVDHIRPGRPGENGAHERMHRTLKAEATRPPASGMEAQQRRFAAFRREYNHERPHEAIGQRTPAMLYRPSTRPYPGRWPDEDVYPGHWERRAVRADGTIKWRGELLFLGEPLAGRLVGLCETDEDLWELHYQRALLGLIDARRGPPVVRDALPPATPIA